MGEQSKARLGGIFALTLVVGGFLTAVLSAATGAKELAPGIWPMFHRDLLRTGLSPFDTTTNPGKLRWKFSAPSYVDGGPVVGPDGTIYVESLSAGSYAVDPSGVRNWSVTWGGTSSPAVGADGTIYFSSYDHAVHAVAADGSPRWTYTTGAEVRSSPAIGPDGTIYVGSNDANLYALNPDGSPKWKFKTMGYVFGSPAVDADGTLYVGSDDHNVYAVNPDGTQKWAFTTGGTVGSSAAIAADGTIYVGSQDDNLYAINPDGSQKWQFITSGPVYSSPAIGADGTIYVGSNDHNLYAINPDGSQKWQFATGGAVYSSPAIGADGTIFVGSWDDNLYAIDPDGSGKWTFTTGGPVLGSPAIGADGTVYFGSWDGNLYAIGLPPATSTALAQVTASPVVASGVAGQRVGAGSFTVRNESETSLSITAAGLTFTTPSIFSSVTLTGPGGQSVTFIDPASTCTVGCPFEFNPPIGVPVGGSASFKLSARLAGGSGAAGLGTERPVARAGMLPQSFGSGSVALWLVLTMLGLVMTPFCGSRRERTVLLACALLLLSVTLASCGGGGGGQTQRQVGSTQALVLLDINAGVAGLPAGLGTVYLQQ